MKDLDAAKSSSCQKFYFWMSVKSTEKYELRLDFQVAPWCSG